MPLQPLVCPSCAGALEVPSGQSLITCGFCSVTSVLDGGKWAAVAAKQLSGGAKVAELQELVERRLVKDGIVGASVSHEVQIKQFVGREGRCRVTPEASSHAHRDRAKSYEWVVEGLFAVPLTDGGELLLLEDLSLLEDSSEPVPSVEGHLLSFEDDVQRAMVERAEQRIFEKSNIRYQWKGMDVHSTFHDGWVVLDAPLVRFTVEVELENTLTILYDPIAPDHRYSVVYDGVSGELISWDAPRKRANLLLYLGIFLFVMVVMPILGTVLSTVLMGLFSCGASVVLGFLSSLG